ncbi:MAG: alanine dehydrogenase [Methylovulum sp.]|uniref:alanine dehydrogenase n=1 Tax=Methylovulum sp. TaxID=1916980 RepID=UPI0026312359|nr:alanine dehydrogenase [Methylovulum sp.]MDD2722830.1 alanine dehydrogenase [Methylovulum sp.]MDD5124408.1 alanine dehydrogenase [Methylovulum sp.]
MKIGIPKEIKDQEGRVAMTPAGVQALLAQGHTVVVESDAGLGAGFTNQQYQMAGAKLVPVAQAWDVDLVVKVKEPLPAEYPYLDTQMVFTFFHLAGVTPSLTEALLAKGTTAIAYETLEDGHGRLPILAPMSAIAGNMATLMGAYYLARFNQGKGLQLGKVLGKPHGKVVVVGDGVVGQHAAQVACGMGAQVWVAGIDAGFMASIKAKVLPEANFFLSSPENLSQHIADADLVVGAVLCRGALAPKIITEAMIQSMTTGSVVVDVSIDQGGCIATSKPTSHSHPVFIEHGVVHYCVTNMPGAYPRTATVALEDATLPYTVAIAALGKAGLMSDQRFAKAVNVMDGKITCKAVAEALGMMDVWAG